MWASWRTSRKFMLSPFIANLLMVVMALRMGISWPVSTAAASKNRYMWFIWSVYKAGSGHSAVQSKASCLMRVTTVTIWE